MHQQLGHSSSAASGTSSSQGMPLEAIQGVPCLTETLHALAHPVIKRSNSLGDLTEVLPHHAQASPFASALSGLVQVAAADSSSYAMLQPVVGPPLLLQPAAYLSSSASTPLALLQPPAAAVDWMAAFGSPEAVADSCPHTRHSMVSIDGSSGISGQFSCSLVDPTATATSLSTAADATAATATAATPICPSGSGQVLSSMDRMSPGLTPLRHPRLEVRSTPQHPLTPPDSALAPVVMPDLTQP